MAKKQTKAKKNRKGLSGFFFKLILVAIIVVVGYTIYLDAQIKHTFSGNKWEVPAQIFARPLRLSERLEITPQEVLDELDLLGYRKVTRPGSSGEYTYWNRKLIVMRRAFEFANGPEPLRKI